MIPEFTRVRIVNYDAEIDGKLGTVMHYDGAYYEVRMDFDTSAGQSLLFLTRELEVIDSE